MTKQIPTEWNNSCFVQCKELLMNINENINDPFTSFIEENDSLAV